MVRGQAHTLEAVVGALLLMAALVFALQTTAVTPLSASTASQHIENQEQAIARGVLANAERKNALKPAVLYWDETSDGFHNAPKGYYTNGGPPNRFGAVLERAFGQHGIAFNVYLHYQTQGTGDLRRLRMVYVGEPSDNAVRATRSVTLYDEDHLYEPSGFGYAQRDSAVTVNTTGDFYAPKAADPGDGFYNLVRVEVVVWRM